jgi:hypothetical protein
VLYQEAFEQLGIPCVITDPRAMEYRRAQLFAGSEPVDLIYKRVLITELVKECGLDNPYGAGGAGPGGMHVNPFRSKILHKKASLAVLSDEKNRAPVPPRRAGGGARLHSLDPAGRGPAHGTRRGTGGLVASLTGTRTRWCPSPTTITAEPASCWAGRPMPRSGPQRSRTPGDTLYRSAAGADPQRAYPSHADGTLQVFDRMLDTAPFVSHADYASGS